MIDKPGLKEDTPPVWRGFVVFRKAIKLHIKPRFHLNFKGSHTPRIVIGVFLLQRWAISLYQLKAPFFFISGIEETLHQWEMEAQQEGQETDQVSGFS